MARLRVGDVVDYEGYLGVVATWSEKYDCPVINWIVVAHPSCTYARVGHHELGDWYPAEELEAKIKVVGRLSDAEAG